jgi:CPA2 family monovalent cation:H+ antiporter-2
VTVWAEIGRVLALTGLIVVGKFVITLLLGLALPAPLRTFVVVSAGLSQIGEFSFIIGSTGVALGLLTQDQYGLILAGALLSIVVNPLMYRLIPAVERLVERIPLLSRRMRRGEPVYEAHVEEMSNHVVLVGYGRVGKHIAGVLDRLDYPYLVVEQDISYAAEIQQEGVETLIGDAANSGILTHAGLAHACALVVTVPNETTAELVVVAARDLAPELPIVARAETESGVQRLAALGARHVIQPELEGGLEIVRHTLLILGYPVGQIQSYIDSVRSDTYEGILPGDRGYPVLDVLLSAIRGTEVAWEPVRDGSPLIGKTLQEASIRSAAGASVVALVRDGAVSANPSPGVRFRHGDLLGLIGSVEELTAARELIDPQRVIGGE